MEPCHVIQIVFRNGDLPTPLHGRAAAHETDDVGDERAAAEDETRYVLTHRELDELLLREARRAADELMKASAALHAASAVVLEAVAALHDGREDR